MSVSRLAINIVREQGVFSLYTGISASLCRQLSYSTVRFGIYEVRLYFTSVFTNLNVSYLILGRKTIIIYPGRKYSVL